MTRHLALACLVLCWFQAGTASAYAEKQRDLIALVLIDAVRPDHLGVYGYDRPTSPNIDAFAQSSTRYERVYANAPWTRPSTASFLTGLNGSRHRTESAQDKLPPSIVTLAQRLSEAGYTTAGFCANGNGGSLAGLHRGFDLFEDPTNTYTKKARGKTYNGLPTGEFLIKRALKWLRQSDAEKIFVFLFLVDPHDPYRAPPRLEKQFLGKDFKGKVRRRALWEANNDYPQEEVDSMIAVYDASIRYADEAFGRFVSGLRRQDRFEKATVFVSADHGEGFGEHNFYLHAHHFWEEVIRIPLLARGPRFKPGVDPRLTQSLDVARTILELAGVKAEELPGRSLLQPSADEAYVISEYNEFGIHRQAITDGRYKVIWQRPANEARYIREAKKKEYFPSVSFDREVVRVFDLANDPLEKNDLGARMPETAKTLLGALRAFVATSEKLAHGSP